MSEFQRYLEKEPNVKLAKTLKWIIWVLTIVVFGLVGMMRRPEKIDLGMDLSFLPPVHAVLNTGVAILLVVAIITVKRKNIKMHKLAINAAMLLSVAFLLCYVAYHFTTDEVKFEGVGTIRSVYFFLLITHIVLAGVSLPLILLTWMYGVTNQFKKHRKFAKITFPMWLYVAVTGPVCYLLLQPYY